ncbi:MAG: hypothetical protein QQN60_04480 [Nitrosopumilus sp.]
MKDKYNYSPLRNKIKLARLRKKKQEIKTKDRYLAKQTSEEQKIQQLILPDVPKSRLEWSLKVRPTIDGRNNIVQYMPMLQRLHEDDWSWIMVKFARQMTKSAYLATAMGHLMTTKSNQKTTFCTFEEEALTAFSRDKFRTLWSESELARLYVDGATLGSLSSIRTKNNSSANLVTAVNSFQHVEGKSVNLLIFDEGQNLDLDEWVTASESQSFTNGAFIIAGIGGYVDTEYTKWWESSDQRHWIYSNKYWRSKLDFRKSGTDRLIWDEYLIDVLAGYWKAKKQENQSRHGYFSNQYQAPWIPLKKIDCEKYGLPENKSIQWKEENYPQNDFIRHVEGKDVAGDTKPFTSQMLYKLYDKNRSLLKPSEVDYEKGNLFFGADWGGGFRTIRWIYQYVDGKFPQFILINADRIETDDVEEQYNLACEWIDDYEISQSVVDAGGGTYQVQQLMKRYGESCLKFHYLTRPDDPEPDLDELRKYSQENSWARDKTFLMDTYRTRIIKPYLDGNNIINQIVWPAKDPSKLDWIVDHHTNELTELIKLSRTGTYYSRYYTPDKVKRPDDGLHGSIMSMEAQYVYGDGPQPTTFGQFEAPDPYDY